MTKTHHIWDRWEHLAAESPERDAIIHWDFFEKPFRWTYGALVKAAWKVADHLIRQGVQSGDVCALIIRHHRFFYPVYMGVAMIGAIPAVLAYPNARLHPQKFVDGLLGMAQRSGLKWILTEKELDSSIRPLVFHQKSSIKEILFPPEWDISVSIDFAKHRSIKNIQKDIAPSDPFLLQHSSGTTGLQKGVVLSHAAILEHVKRYAEAIALTTQDKIASWLPLYHDMGLIAAFHLPLSLGVPIVQIDPFQWTSAPVVLMQAISEEKATLTWLPNFAYNFMADRIRDEDMKSIRLDSMRMFINCSECIRDESHEKFYSRFSPYGVKKDSLAACYAMAETTFAVTQTKPSFKAKKLKADRIALSKGYFQRAENPNSMKVCVSSGGPISGCRLKIIDEKGVELSEDCIGEVAVRSVSLFNGYIHQSQISAEVMRDGWYLSGDYGFLHEGEYYIIGRKKDIIIVAGKNIYPEDIEDAVNQVAGVAPGRVVAFGREDRGLGTEKICVIAETSVDEQCKESLKIKIIQAAMAIDLTVAEVHLVPPRWLIKSSSGKPCRKTNKERILKNDICAIKNSHS